MSVTKNMRSRCGTLLFAALVAVPLLAGCSDFTPPAHRPDQGYVTPPPVVPLPVVPGFDPPTRSGQVYLAAPSLDALYAKYLGTSFASRYILYDDSTFALEVSSAGSNAFQYDGRFTRVDSTITFIWKGWSAAGPWGAEGTLFGDSLRVRYNLIMQLTDFLDGTYGRVPPP